MTSRLQEFGWALLRRSFFAQGWLMLAGVPLTVAALLNVPEAGLVVLPWGAYVYYLYLRVQETKDAEVSEHFPGTLRYRVSDRVVLKMLRFNAVVVLVLILALIGHGHITPW